MAVTTTASLDGGNRVITITLSAPQEKADNLANDAARQAYESEWKKSDIFKDNDVEVEYDDLTNQQKLSILGLETQRWLKLIAKSYYIYSAVSSAQTTAEEDVLTRYNGE